MMLKFKRLLCFILISILAHAEELPWLEEGKHGSELEIVRPFLPENPIVLEAGAHKGEDTVIFVQKWPLATVYAFEPSPEYFGHLKLTTARLSNVHAYNFGLFSKTGNYEFHASATYDGASSLFEDNYPSNKYNDSIETVYCMNLDEWASEWHVDHIDYMWLDMEGAELEMLKYAPKILQTVTAISTEVNFKEFRKGMAQFQEMKDFLVNAGFTLYKIWGSPTWQATAVFIRL